MNIEILTLLGLSIKNLKVEYFSKIINIYYKTKIDNLFNYEDNNLILSKCIC
jgi:hypothetical protein